MIIDEKIYLEHVGVKGMRWGVRKQKSESSRQSRSQSNRRAALNSGVKAGLLAGAVGAGAAFVLYKMGDSKVSTRHINGLSSTRRGKQASSNMIGLFGKNKIIKMSPELHQRASAASAASRAGPTMKSAASKHLGSINDANKILKAHYDKFNVPFPKRELLDTSYWSRLAG